MKMKGAMSGEIDSKLVISRWRVGLFPHNHLSLQFWRWACCGYWADHADLVKFHQSHYHPNNAVVMSFGKYPVAETQARIHEDALAVAGKAFAKGKTRLTTRKSLTAPISVTDTLQCRYGETQTNHHVMAWLLPSILTVNSVWLCDYLKAYWLNMPGSPLRAYLDSHPLASAPTPLLGLDWQPLSDGVLRRGSWVEPEHGDAIEQGILDLLKQVADQPVDSEAIENHFAPTKSTNVISVAIVCHMV